MYQMFLSYTLSQANISKETEEILIPLRNPQSLQSGQKRLIQVLEKQSVRSSNKLS